MLGLELGVLNERMLKEEAGSLWIHPENRDRAVGAAAKRQRHLEFRVRHDDWLEAVWTTKEREDVCDDSP